MASALTRLRRLFRHWPWVVPAVLCVAAAVAPPASLARLDALGFDTLVRTLSPARPDPSIVIVDVDNRSLATLGQWPWRRDRLADLIAHLHRLQPRAIALDVVFSEVDRAGGVEADAAFTEVLRRAPVLLGYAMTFGDQAAPHKGCVLHPLPVTVVQPPGAAEESPLFAASGVICPLPDLARAAGASGFLNAAPDRDGILRRVPMVVSLADRVYPSLGLATAMTALRMAGAELRVVNENTTRLAIGERTLPLDGRGNLLLRLRGRRRTFPFLSAADVVSGTVTADAVRGKIVFVGATALGMQELVATARDPQFIGVEVQATVADNILQGDFFHRPEGAAVFEAAASLGAAVLVGIAAARLGLLGAALAGLTSLVLAWGGAYLLLDRWGLVLSPLLPSLAALLSGTALAMATLTRASRESAADARRATSEAATSARARQEFLLSVSRELRTPLSAMQGYAQVIAKGAMSEERRAQALAALERNAIAQTQVIDDLLDASRAAGGRLQIAMEPVDFGAVVRSAVESLQPAAMAKRISIDIVMGAGGTVMGDCDRLRQATWHLVSNAVKFTPDGGRVAVVLGVGPEGAHLAVADTGAGIAPEVLPRLVAGEAANGSSRASGLGLGLSLVRHIVELHGGVLSAESPGLGAGATFRVRLPPARTSNGDAAHVSAPRLDGVRVVVVDERADARGLVASALLRAGASVVTAASGQYALLLMRDDSRDVFVVNVGTRDRSGYWVAREALAVALNRGERLTIIAIGAPGKGGADRPAEIGIERHLASPVDPAELVRAIADSVRQSPNRQVGR